MINLIFGCSGSGKSQRIIKRIKELIAEKKKIYLLVPEQQVFTTEAIFAELDGSAGLYLEVVSFSRICELVFEKYGGINYVSLSEGIRNLIMWQSIKEIAPALSEYGKISADTKFTELMISTADELKANSISFEALEEAALKSENPPFKSKLSDISAILASYTVHLEKALGEGALQSENKLEQLLDCLHSHVFFKDCYVFVDSFTDFTDIQHKILAQIMKQAEDVWISVYSKGRGYSAPHVDSIKDTVRRLTRAARESGRDFCDTELHGNTRTHSAQLKRVEEYLWDFTAKRENLREIPQEQSHDIEMISCADEYEETECAALKILEARSNGLKYSDIAVIMRNPEERAGIIDAVFSKYGIPYFISEKTQLTQTPAARFILSSLRCISGNYRQSDVITLLKTGLCEIDDSDADLFEEYCLTWNIQGKDFTAPVWSMNPNGYTTDRDERSDKILECANRVRSTLITPLEELKIKFKASEKSAMRLCRALCSYMERRNLHRSLSSLAELELSLGNIKEAGEILRVYDYILSALSDICRVLGDTPLSEKELLDAIEIMLSHTDIASVPSICDYVTVGSAATLRVENIKIAILMELCEGMFPAIPKDNGLICEDDKEALENFSLTFKSRRSRLMSDELFYVYRAMTKPSERLIVTTYSSSISGGAKVPSTAWRRLEALFELPVEQFDIKAIRLLSRAKSEQAVTQSLNDRITEYFGEDAEKLSVCDMQNTHTAAEISDELVRQTFGDVLYLSKSRIQSFVKCPMSFWCQSVLRLRTRASSQITSAQSGTLIHYVLENLFREIRLNDGSLPPYPSDKLLSLTDKWVDKYITLTNCPRSPSLMYEFSRFRNLAYCMVKDISDEFKQSGFKMHSFEQSISGYGANSLKPLSIALDKINGCPKVLFGGTADRIDTYTSGEKTYIRIIDYKTGDVSFDSKKVNEGTDIQLPAYLFAVASDENSGAFTKNGVLIPGASIYVSASESEGNISIKRSGIIYDNEELLLASSKELDYKYISTSAEKANKSSKLGSCGELFSDEAISEMKNSVVNIIKDTGTKIYSGKIERTPSPDSCKFCPVRSTCPVAEKPKY